MKKFVLIFAATVFSSFAALSLCAQESSAQRQTAGDWSFWAQGKMGARVGVQNEIVWAKRNFDGARYKQSELNYELLPVFYAGVDFGARYKRLGLNLYSKFFFNQKSGTLKDSDWRNDSFCSNGDTTTKTDCSEHKLSLAEKFAGIAGFDLELQGDFEFHPTSFLTLAPLFSLNAQCMSYSATGGQGWYGKYDNKENRIASCYDENNRLIYSFGDKKVLEYEVYNFFVWTGLRTVFKPASWISIYLASEVSPFSALLDFDNHLTNYRYFKEIALSAFFAFRQTVRTEFKCADNCSLCQNLVFIWTGESEGAMFYKNAGEDSYRRLLNNTGGGQMICLDIEFSIKIRL